MDKDPIKEIQDFHQEVLRQLDMLERALEKFREDSEADDARLSLDGFYYFVKKDLSVHLRDEEEALFPLMRMHEYPEREINAILNDHKDLFVSVETLRLLKGIDRSTFPEIERGLCNIIETLRDHIWKEDNVIFRLASESLTPREMAEVSERMAKIRE
jgi:iron-sulfur cluster repair protein YtfE (RIC family)